MAKQFVTEGANVVITGRNEERLAEAKKFIAEAGPSIETFQMDVRVPEHAEAMLAFAIEKFGQVDGLVNNAAGNFIVRAEDLSPEWLEGCRGYCIKWYILLFFSSRQVLD